MKLPKSLPTLKKPKTLLPLMVRRVHGHSMLPILPPGTLVWGWCWFKRLEPDQVVIFIHQGKEKLKRIDKMENQKLFVLGDHELASTDSRHFGWIEPEAVVAKVIWPRTRRR